MFKTNSTIMKTRYKFLREGLKSNRGNHTWQVGQWYHEDEVDLCNKGFHCSKEIWQAFSYVQGEIFAEVEVKGKSDKSDDKEVWSDMRIIKAYKWQKKDSVALSIYSAELCINEFEKVYPTDKRPREAIEAAKKWLLEPTKENESAAAWSAASAAASAESAARSASAESAARSAAWSARSAAWSARSARSAESAWSAARDKSLSIAAELCVGVLIEMKSPGCKWLDLTPIEA